MIPKFRLWDKRLKLKLDVHVIDFYERTIDCYVDDLGVNRQEVYSYEMNEDNYVLMQYTGLADKNGREIFEGDILHVWIEDEYIPNRDSGGGIIDYDCEPGFSQIGKVEFESSSFDYSTVKTLSGNHEEIHLSIDWLSNYEIIGNIHEHPELLGEQT